MSAVCLPRAALARLAFSAAPKPAMLARDAKQVRAGKLLTSILPIKKA